MTFPLASDDLDRLIGVPEAAVRLDMHVVTAYVDIKEGRFPVPVLQVNGRKKVSLRQLVEYINSEQVA